MPSGLIALFRGLVGAVFLLLVMLACKKRPDPGAWRKNLIPLCFFEAFLGANWILLFESYNVDPVGAILLSVVILSERMGVFETIGVILIIGAALVSELELDRRRK